MRVFRRSLWDERTTLSVWALVLILYVLYAASSFESFGRTGVLTEVMNAMPPYLRVVFGGLDWATLDGYLNGYLYSWLPLLIAFYTGLAGAGALARETDSHTIESLLAQPVRRWSVVLEKFAVVATGAVFLHLVVHGSLVASLALFAKGKASFGALAVAGVASFLTSLCVGGLALFVSALVNEQRKATAYALGLVMLLYFVNVIGQVSSKAKFITKINPFGRYHPADIILSGRLAWADAVFLIAFALAFVAAAAWWFERKDIT